MARRSGRERREAEGFIAYWDDKRAAAESGVAVTTLARDLGSMGTPEWTHRFVIALDRAGDAAALVQYGADFARLFRIAPQNRPPLDIRQCLPNPHFEIFVAACRNALAHNEPVLLQRLIDRTEGQREMFRCCFIPVAAEPGESLRFVLGAYNSRLVDPH